MEEISRWIEKLRNLLDVPIIEVGGSSFTLWALVYILILVGLLFYVTGKVKVVTERALRRSSLDAGGRHAVAAVTRYVLLFIGLLVILQTAGINLTTLNVLAGAVGIGVGFGLQNIVSNFISGLIIMFERPIKIGDRIVVDNVEGDVIEIGARSTKVLSNDNITIIVPNSKFITENVVNWKYNDASVRFRIPVGVAYGTDAREVEKILLEVAASQEDVLEDPPPAVRFIEFGESSLNLELRAWTTSAVGRRGRFVSGLNFAIYDKFRERGIEIPFPQRDVHIRSGALEARPAKG